ncbi:probable histidine kinase 1 [Vicia villosa]|uniref:probable histidine kinase 1 n=1 Tax=Vicia villosa TaxID=3911 RepID=UPI00273AB9CE|nr:probable histidine kinase 1 [Vicia villosa]
MVCEMESDCIEDDMMEIEVLPSMWPEDVGTDVGKQFNIEKPGRDQDMLEEVTILEEPAIADFQRLMELTNYTEKGSSQLAYLMKHWEYKQANAVRLLREELDNLSKQRKEVELRKLEILKDNNRFEEESYGGDKRPVSILDDVYYTWQDLPVAIRKSDVVVQNKRIEIEAEYDTVVYWKHRSQDLEKQLEASIRREEILKEKLQESIETIERQSSPVEELSQILKRADNFLHFILQNAPVVIGHQDKELRYRFIYNHFPSLQEEDIIGKTDVEIFTGSGVKESQDFKREVMEKGVAAKKEITFETELFGAKTFLIYVEPVFSKTGETIGVNYMGMEITDQVRKRERMAKLREEIAVQKAKETELNKTIHITEETMRAKQMLATMSHEIRSPLSGVVSMAEILTTTKLDREQRQLLDVMISSGDLVLQLINDILDLSKVESGAMKLEATKFRPREVVRHVLQTAAASLQKMLTLEGDIADDIPIEVTGDVLRIRQILTNLVSNAVKFTHQGKVGINLYVVPEPSFAKSEECHQKVTEDQSTVSSNGLKEEKQTSSPRSTRCDQNLIDGKKHTDQPIQNQAFSNECSRSSANSECSMNDDTEEQTHSTETTVWIRCDVFDTGIGIPEKAIPTLFRRYMQVSADHARKYGGTGLGLAICKQLVELMGGRLTVTSKEHCGSTFTFILPYKVSTACDNSDDPDDLSDVENNEDDTTEGFFQFQPRTLGSLFSSNGSTRPHRISHKLNGFPDNNSYSNLSSNINSNGTNSIEDASSVIVNASDMSESTSSSSHCSETKHECLVNGNKQNHDNDKAHVMLENGTANSSQYKEAGREMDLETKSSEPQQTTCQGQRKEDSTSSTSTSSEVTKSTLKPNILLVEDNKINIMVTKSMMKQLGYSMDVVNNGVEAIREIQRHSYDIILMDVYMPVMNGLQTTKLIRSYEESGNWDAAREAGIEPSLSTSDDHSVPPKKRIHIVAMTANTMSESAEECFANGMDAFVSKPVTLLKLKECLEKHLR